MGMQCRHVRPEGGVSEPVPLKPTHKGDICRRCEQWYTNTVRATNKDKWVQEVLEAIESVRGWSSEQEPPNEASLWHLYELNPDNGREGKPSERGECLCRLSVKTLTKLRGWLDANEEEAVERYTGKHVRLRAEVGILAMLPAVLSDGTCHPEKQDEALPFNAVGYKRSGRAVRLDIPVRLELVRRKRRYMSERNLEKELGVSRSTLRDISARMTEIGFSLEKFTPEELSYIVRGPKHKPSQGL